MSKLPSQISKITAQLIGNLVEQRVRESRHLDYKGKYHLTSKNPRLEEERNELRKDATALANADGGHIVVGVEEEEVAGKRTGYPALAPGVADAEDARRAISGALGAGIDPPIRFEVASVAGFPDGPCIVIYVPPSQRRPHRIENTRRIPIRRGEETTEMDMDQIREMILTADGMWQRADRWLDARYSEIVKQSVLGVPKLKGRENPLPVIVVHVGSREALERGAATKLLEDAENQISDWILPGGANHTHTFDGYLLSNGSFQEASAYVIALRSGWIEFAAVLTAHRSFGDRILGQLAIEQVVVDRVCRSFSALHRIEFTAPFLVSVALLGVKGVGLYNAPHAIDRPELMLERIAFDELPRAAEGDPAGGKAVRQAVAKAMRPAFDQLSQAAGLTGSGSFDAAGTWSER
jgi:hypothetical protein